MKYLNAFCIVLALSLFAGCKDDTGGNDAGTGDDAGDTQGSDGTDQDTAEDSTDTVIVPDVDDAGGGTLRLGETCVEDRECVSALCFKFQTEIDQGICSRFCADDLDCSDAEGFQCVFVLNSEGDVAKLCVPEDLCIDPDEDGYGLGSGCLGTDCNEERSDVNSGADEVCDGVDNDCDGNVDENPIDANIDCSTGLAGPCALGRQFCTDGVLFCEQQRQSASEICDGIDNDCDGEVDNSGAGELISVECYAGPEELVGIGACARGVRSCAGGEFTVCEGQVLPTIELCDGVDNDCNGEVDDNAIGNGICDTGQLGVCAIGNRDCEAGSDDCNPQFTPSLEQCDGLDNDCDGVVDENESPGANPGDPIVDACYGGPANTEGVGVCTGGDRVCAGGLFSACVGQVLPSPEVCDGLDNDCNGTVDDGSASSGADCTGTGLPGVCDAGTLACEDGTTVCVATTQPGDNVEVCDGVDNDCDGEVDEDTAGIGTICVVGVGECTRTGVFICDVTDSGAPAVCSADPGSGSPEVCDGRDNDCDGETDEGAAWSDLGNGCLVGEGVCAEAGIQVCDVSDPSGATVCSAQPDTSAQGAEQCDGQDNDCDGSIDEDFNVGQACSAGLGECATQGVFQCDGPSATVCGANPPSGTSETCDGRDNDCDGTTDEGFGVGQPCSVGLGVCARPGVNECNSAGTAAECVGTPGPAGTEVCNGQDDNCDGVIDDGFVDGSGRYTRDVACGACAIDCTDIFGNPNASGVCDTGGSSPECEMVCDGGYFNLNEVPQDGCEFFLDPDAIYVSQNGGNDSGACGLGPAGTGSGNFPCATIARGVTRANSLNRSRVLVADGAYEEQVVMQNGIDLLGGHNPLDWGRNVAGTLTAIRGTTTGGDEKTVIASGITSATVLEGFLIYGVNAVGLGANSYGIYASNSSSALTIRNNSVFAGPGAAGAAGAGGASGANGENGGTGQNSFHNNCNNVGSPQGTPGAGGSLSCDNPGGGSTDVSGGDGGAAVCPDRNQQEGSGESGRNGGGAGGPGGWGHETGGGCSPTSGELEVGTTGTNAPADDTSRDGSSGNPCNDNDGSVSGGEWRASSGNSGGNGDHGRGGGGGGAGGGQDLSSGRDVGGSGGGGGSGGCAGRGGGGGGGGGGSFGIFITYSSGPSAGLPVVTGNQVTRNSGGAGGQGGLGGGGGSAGVAGLGGVLGDYDGPIFCVFGGANGGNGSRGGHGGGGGGGCGGVSFDIAVFNTGGASQNYGSANTFPLGGTDTAGAGGEGGISSNPNNNGNPGSDGASGTVLVRP